ncbi:hypothetical protein ACUN0C_06755 [Faunimonas sp. B44]|uniref:hypothetical protein n=1 Tax=Faunimonas sp. B44 TaxID=3461493 RepID=UPI004044BA97
MGGGRLNVLVLGLARTGTTVISETIARAIGADRYVSEPRTIETFQDRRLLKAKRAVVKVLFEHWSDRPNLRRGVVADECAVKFDRRIFVVRDPRDELISRLHFFILSHIDNAGYDPGVCDRWLDLLRRKEEAPGSVSVLDLVRAREAIFGKGAIAHVGKNRALGRFIAGTAHSNYVLRYEDFIAGDRAELGAYLGCGPIELADETRFAHRKRTGAAENWKRYFTAEDVKHFRPRYGPVMEPLGYHDWALEPVDRLDPAVGSGYVEELVTLARARKRRRWPFSWRPFGRGRYAP